jgi:hypothetical protein
MWTRRLTGALLAALCLTANVRAHHSIAAVYDQKNRVMLEGVIVEFRFVNPHPFFTMTVNRSGNAETWKLELDNRVELVDVGMKGETIKPGDRVVVSASPARDGSHVAYAQRIDRPADGFWYEQVGTSPKIGRR